VAAYIDLNPVVAGIVPLPEQSLHNSIKERVDNAVAQGRMEDVEQIRNI
jgi:tRNA A37 N6-isopentenylltransferase MiaA